MSVSLDSLKRGNKYIIIIKYPARKTNNKYEGTFVRDESTLDNKQYVFSDLLMKPIEGVGFTKEIEGEKAFKKDNIVEITLDNSVNSVVRPEGIELQEMRSIPFPETTNDVKISYSELSDQRGFIGLEKLKPGLRYYFKTTEFPGFQCQATFVGTTQTSSGKQYRFEDLKLYNKKGKVVSDRPSFTFGGTNVPKKFYIYNSEKLNPDVNRYISEYGGKSRKSKRRRHKKTTQRRKKKSTLRRHKKSM